jgi:hypothetical protein
VAQLQQLAKGFVLKKILDFRFFYLMVISVIKPNVLLAISIQLDVIATFKVVCLFIYVAVVLTQGKLYARCVYAS